MLNAFHHFRLVPILGISISVLFAQVQPDIEYLGLDGVPINDMDIYGSVITAGTDSFGVYYQTLEALPDSNWINAGLTGKNVTAVYPHKSGPIGWGITAGLNPAENDTNFVYCNFMGDDFFANSLGISDSLIEGVYSLSGFPDPSICGEKYAATGRILYRQLFGDSIWTPVAQSPGYEGAGIITVKTAETLGGIVLAGGSEGYSGILLIKSVDNGDNWDHLYPPGPLNAIDFSADSAGTDVDTIFVSHGTSLSRSVDGGATWETIQGSSIYNYFHDILYDPETGYVFACGEDGHVAATAFIFFSPDRGSTWMPIPTTIGSACVSCTMGNDGYLYFATAMSGVYRLDTYELNVNPEPVPRDFTLQQNYPNPFNVSTIIKYSIREKSHVKLIVYNLLGEEVDVLVEGIKPAKTYRIRWDANDLPSGIYIYRLETDEMIITKKMVVLK